jgi:hypothetical protein
MTAQEKAEELVNKYLIATPVWFHIDDAKKCALIAVDEIIKYQDSLIGMLDTNDGTNPMFWEDVKQEIENL